MFTDRIRPVSRLHVEQAGSPPISKSARPSLARTTRSSPSLERMVLEPFHVGGPKKAESVPFWLPNDKFVWKSLNEVSVSKRFLLAQTACLFKRVLDVKFNYPSWMARGGRSGGTDLRHTTCFPACVVSSSSSNAKNMSQRNVNDLLSPSKKQPTR